MAASRTKSQENKLAAKLIATADRIMDCRAGDRQLTGSLRSHLATAGRIIGADIVVWHIAKTRKIRGPDGGRLKEPKWFLLAHPATKARPDLW